MKDKNERMLKTSAAASCAIQRGGGVYLLRLCPFLSFFFLFIPVVGAFPSTKVKPFFFFPFFFLSFFSLITLFIPGFSSLLCEPLLVHVSSTEPTIKYARIVELTTELFEKKTTTQMKKGSNFRQIGRIRYVSQRVWLKSKMNFSGLVVVYAARVLCTVGKINRTHTHRHTCGWHKGR